MNQSRSAAERMRPILQAMERSIDAARRRRTHQVQPPERPQAPATPPPPAEPTGRAERPRLKARPKRPSPFSGHNRGEGYRSQAG